MKEREREKDKERHCESKAKRERGRDRDGKTDRDRYGDLYVSIANCHQCLQAYHVLKQELYMTTLFATAL